MGGAESAVLQGLDMSHTRCAPACALFDLPDVHALTIEHEPTVMTLTIEIAPKPAGCPGCGILALPK